MRVMLRICSVIVFLAVVFIDAPLAQTGKLKKEVQTEFIVDESGNLTPDSTEVTKLYSKHGAVIEEIEKSIWPQLQRVVVYTKKHFNDRRGKNDSTLTFIDGKPKLTLKPKYDSAGREIEVQEVSTDGTPGYRGRNIYAGSSTRKSRQEMYDPDGKLFNFKDYSYDRKGNLLEESGTEQGQPRYRWSYRYDDENRLIERMDYSGTGSLIEIHRYEYGADKRISRENIVNAQNKLVRVMKYRCEYY
jgi:hypothetical protein